MKKPQQRTADLNDSSDDSNSDYDSFDEDDYIMKRKLGKSGTKSKNNNDFPKKRLEDYKRYILFLLTNM